MSLLQKLRNPKGFTLVELIIVIMIIGILAATLLPKVMGAPAKARDAGRQADLNALATATEMYYADNEAYPNVAVVLAATGTDLSSYLVSGGYLKSTLVDPKDTGGYVYVYCAATVNGVSDQVFAISTRLESSTGASRVFTVGKVEVITESTADDVKATVAAGATVGNYVYGASTCVDV